MNTLPAGEIKKRGVQAIEEGLAKAPVVYIIKNNRPRCVVLTEELYLELIRPHQNTLYHHLLEMPSQGTRSKEDIDQELKQLRDEWDKPNENLS